MDADGQDDPAEIPELLDALDERARPRHRAPRRPATTASSSATPRSSTTASPRKVTGVEGEDFNSGLKVMRARSPTRSSSTASCTATSRCSRQWNGFEVGEVDVEHRRAPARQSKFGRARFWRGFLDLITVKFLTTYTGRPFHLFGGVGIALRRDRRAAARCGCSSRSSAATRSATGRRCSSACCFVSSASSSLSLGLLAELIVHFRRDREPDLFVEPERPR